VATVREEAIFLCFLQGKDIEEIKRIFMLGEAMLNKHLDRVIDKVLAQIIEENKGTVKKK
ncbi:hypothetical protein, partial [Macrococcus capreoli]|uniref:hypothetical protein n=1 Tax=Macrococcus capreoli TaxID=2982690 RepID=UPI0021D57737